MKTPVSSGMKDALRTQLKNYDTIEKEAFSLAEEKGWELKEIDPAIKRMSDMMTRMKLSMGNPTSKAAAMMIHGNTRGIIKGYKNQNQYPVSDQRIWDLSQKLLECEKQGCQQMQGFL